MEPQDSAGDKSSDRSADQSRRSSRSEKRGDKVQTGDGGKNRLPAGVVRREAGGSGEPQTTDKDVGGQVEKRKISIKNYQQTAAAAKRIESLNRKTGVSPSPSRSSPSPPRSSVSALALGNRFGFMDFGPKDDNGHTPSQAIDPSEVMRNRLLSEQRARAALNEQTEFLMNQANGPRGAHSGRHGDHEDHLHAPRGGHEGLDHRHAPPQYPDISGVQTSPNLLMGLIQNFGQVQAQILEQNARWQKLQEEKLSLDNKDRLDSGNKATSLVNMPNIAGDVSDKSGSDSDDELEMDWSGQLIEQKSADIIISEPAMEFWASLVGLDEKGIQNGTFKSLVKKTKKVKQYIEGKKAMNPQELESEIPRMWGWQLKEEDELVANQKTVGAVAVATCLAVDAARATVDDLKASGKDFEDGVFDDPSAEAAKLCAAVADLIEDKIIANSIQSLKFTATAFGTFTLKRRALALRQVSDTETKRVLEKTPPDEEFLFGGKVKESVQKSRDSNQIKRAMQPPKRDWKSKKVFKPYYRKDGGSKVAPKFPRPMSDRFKGGDKKWRRRDKKVKKGKDSNDD